MIKDYITATDLMYSIRPFLGSKLSGGIGIFLLIVLLVVCQLQLMAQKQDYVWLQGYDSDVGFDSSTNTLYGTSVLDFNYTPRSIYYDSIQMNFTRTNTSYCDSNGSLLFYTNGIYIANSLDDKVANGDSLNWGGLISVFDPGIYDYGYRTSQGILPLQNPANNQQYYLLHSYGDTSTQYIVIYNKLLLTTLDMSLNASHGKVIAKNQPLIDNENLGWDLSATRHANGRDWWLLISKRFTNCFYRVLVSNKGVEVLPDLACGGTNVPYNTGGISAFSPDGSKYAYFSTATSINIYEFNRCEGTFTNSYTIPTPALFDSGHYFGGLCFSPSGRFLYAGATVYVFQYDTWAADIAASVDTVAVYDGAQNPFGSYFITMQMGPDGKIYESCGNGEKVYHVIERPDEKGDSCLFIRHSIQLPTFSGGVPNFPNYRLGALAGSGCDTLTDIRHQTSDIRERQIKVFPNPATDYVVVDYGFTNWSKGEVSLEISNELGQVVYAQRLPMYSGFQRIDVSRLAAGGYHVAIKRGVQTVAVGKFSKL